MNRQILLLLRCLHGSIATSTRIIDQCVIQQLPLLVLANSSDPSRHWQPGCRAIVIAYLAKYVIVNGGNTIWLLARP